MTKTTYGLLLALPLVAGAQAPVPSAAWAVPAQSLYRAGQPEVLVPVPLPRPADPTDAHRANFLASYTRAGKPAIAVLWNREFTDLLQQDSAVQSSLETQRSGVAQVDRLPGTTIVGGQSSTSAVLTVRETKSAQMQRSAPGESMDLQMRSAFTQTLAAAGVRLVDRNVVMRTTAARNKGERDTQQVETEALLKHARLLMEVLNTRDVQAPTGWATYVSVKSLEDGVVIAEGYMNGTPAIQSQPKPLPRFEADPKGGFREVMPLVSGSDAGKRAADQTLARLGEAFAR